MANLDTILANIQLLESKITKLTKSNTALNTKIKQQDKELAVLLKEKQDTLQSLQEIKTLLHNEQ
jgi:septal ring factor EnvC (AmiA/AmiB activator)